jgi:hypothetical protein
LEEDLSDELLETFAWSAADFGFPTEITYRLQVDVAGNDFANAQNIGSTTKLSFEEMTAAVLNNAMVSLTAIPGIENAIELRVCASVNDAVEILCSEGVAITVNPYEAEIIYPFLTVPGSYQVNTWTPEDTNYKVISRNSDDNYQGYIYFGIDEAQYKFAQNLSWDINWGDDDADGVLESGGTDITVDLGIGMYLLTANINSLMHTRTKTDWAILGNATSAETALTWDSDKSALTVTLDLTEGNIRFRANGSDDINFGDDNNNGSLENDGVDIPVSEAGNYTIDLIIDQSTPKYVLTKN